MHIKSKIENFLRLCSEKSKHQMKIIYIQTEIMLRKNMPSTYGWMHEDLHVLDGLDTILSVSIRKLS